MWYKLNDIEYVKAIKITWSHKTDVQVQIKLIIKLKDEIDVQNLSIKLVSNDTGFNQIDKRRLKNYRELWEIPNEVFELLQYFCGEKKPYKTGTRDPRRMVLDEMTDDEKNMIINFFKEKKMLIVSDIIRGRGEFCAERMLVVKKTSYYEWVLKSINEVMNFYGNGEVEIWKKWSLKIGRITVQRKGWDNGRATANMLQFKIDPTKLFSIA